MRSKIKSKIIYIFHGTIENAREVHSLQYTLIVLYPQFLANHILSIEFALSISDSSPA